MAREQRKPKRSATRGCLFRVFGVAVAVAVLFGGIALLEEYDPQKTWGRGIGRKLIFVIVPAIAFLFFAAARRREAKGAEQILDEDSRPPVLYLRCFDDDKFGAAMATGLTEEESLAQVMHEIGPFVAVGRPGERLPELGAARMYLGDDEWQKRVRDLMQRSLVVVMRIGNAVGGFLWELKTAAKVLAPEQLVFVVPNNEESYATFREAAEPVLRLGLPDIDFKKTKGGNSCGLITFEPDGSSAFHPLGSKRMRRSMAGPMVAEFKYASRRVFELAGVPWTPPPVSTFRVLKTVYFTILMLAAVAGLAILAYMYFTGKLGTKN